MIEYAESMAYALNGGGWRSEDKEELIEEYELTEEEAESLVKELMKIEEENA